MQFGYKDFFSRDISIVDKQIQDFIDSLPFANQRLVKIGISSHKDGLVRAVVFYIHSSLASNSYNLPDGSITEFYETTRGIGDSDYQNLYQSIVDQLDSLGESDQFAAQVCFVINPNDFARITFWY